MRKMVICLTAALIATAAMADLRMYMDFEVVQEDGGAYYVLDQSGYANHGQLADSAWSTTLPYQTPSANGSNAMLFGHNELGNPQTFSDGPWNSIMVAKSDSIKNLGNQFSMACWVRQDQANGDWVGDYPYLISTPNYGFQLGSGGDPTSYFWPYHPDGTGQTSDWDFGMAPTTQLLGNWLHMAVTWDGSVFTQYINGAPVFTKNDLPAFDTYNTAWDGEFWWKDAPLRIGSDVNAGGPRYLCGAMDDVAIWGESYLDAQGVADLYSGAESPLTVGTVPEPASMLLFGLAGLLIRKK